jgi:uncharacterized membrane protein YtjA (UPF0391 family)
LNPLSKNTGNFFAPYPKASIAGFIDRSYKRIRKGREFFFFETIFSKRTSLRGGTMLRYALVFLVVALIAAAFGFLGIASAAVGIARLLFYVFLVLFLISLVGGIVRKA